MEGDGRARMRGGGGHDQSRRLEEGVIMKYITNVGGHLIYCILLMTVVIKVVHK